MSKAILIQPNGRFNYLTDGHGEVFLVDHQIGQVRKAGFTKRKLSKNKIAYYWTNGNVTKWFDDNEYVIDNVDYDDTGITGFDFKKKVYSDAKVVCDICRKYTTSENNDKDRVQHIKSHFFDSYWMTKDMFLKYWKPA